jgi:hypothetical protein
MSKSRCRACLQAALLGVAIVFMSSTRAADENVKLLCEIEIDSVLGTNKEHASDKVQVEVESIGSHLFIQADGAKLTFAINTHGKTVQNLSDPSKWVLIDVRPEGQHPEQRQVTIDRNTGRLSYFEAMNNFMQTTATGTCAKADITKKLF